jgi:predicted porin
MHTARYCRRIEDEIMKTPPIIAIVFCGAARFAFAQDAAAGAPTAPDAPAPAAEAVSDAAGGHDVAVFTGVPSMGSTGSWSTAPRRSHDQLAGRAPVGGIEGFTLGRQHNLEYLSLADVGDPFHTGTAGQASNLVARSGRRANDNVRYYSSSERGLSTGASWTVDTLGGDPMADRAWGMTVGVDMGMFSLRAAHQNRHVAKVQLYDLAGANMDAKNSLIAANLRMRWGTAYAAYAANRGWGSSPLYNPDNPYGAGVASTSSTDSRDTLVGVAVPVTRATTFLASFIHKNDRDLANRDANQFAVGASYVVSRKTDFYAALSHTISTNGNGLLIGGAARPSGSSAVNVGMRHAF